MPRFIVILPTEFAQEHFQPVYAYHLLRLQSVELLLCQEELTYSIQHLQPTTPSNDKQTGVGFQYLIGALYGLHNVMQARRIGEMVAPFGVRTILQILTNRFTILL